MKKFLTIFSLVIFIGHGLIAQVKVIWGGPNEPNSTFATGLGDWKAIGLRSADPSKAAAALWTWSSNGRADRGAFWRLQSGAPRQSVASTSRGGAAVFDADYLDNGGDGTVLGDGPAPGPQEGVLESPTIDCSNFPTVAVRCFQYYRNFDSKCYVDVSNDGGNNWVPFQVNEEVIRGEETPRNSIVLVEITSVAANRPNVKIRFRWEGYYYFWIIDDVELVEVPENNLKLDQPFYTPYAYAQPTSVICEDTMVFSARLSNLGSKAQDNVILKGEILARNRTTVLFADSLKIGRLEVTDDDTVFRTPNYFVPNRLSPGRYYLRWSTYNEGVTDFYVQDNSRLDSFEVTDLSFSRCPRETGGVRAGQGASYSFGIGFKTANCWNAHDKFWASTATTSFVANPGGSLNGYTVSIYFAKVNPDVEADWSNFDRNLGIASPSVTLLGVDTYTCSSERNYDDITVELTDFENGGTPKIPLEKNTRYFLLVDHPATPPGTIPIFQATSNEKNYNFGYANVVIDQSGTWFGGGFGPGYTPYLILGLELQTKTDETPLPSNAVVVSPNPVVSDELKLEVNFEKPTDINVTIADIQGRVKSLQPFGQIMSQALRINVADYPAGEYLVRVTSSEGSSTKKFVILK